MEAARWEFLFLLLRPHRSCLCSSTGLFSTGLLSVYSVSPQAFCDINRCSTIGIVQIFVYSIFVSMMAFHAQISDPLVGGTYMTLMNTVTNLGGNWPVTACLSIVDDLTWKECKSKQDPSLSLGSSLSAVVSIRRFSF